MSGTLTGRVALVTGAAAGIGRAAAEVFAREGASVVVSDVTTGAGEAVAAGIRAAGGAAVFVACDVSRPEQVQALARATVETFGGLDFAFNNAGVEGTTAPTAECTEAGWDRVMDVNLKGVWLCMREEIPRMLARGGGAIVNCSSVAGLVGFAGIAPYTASKHGLIGLTKTAALEYATQGIRVNAVCPGVIRTAMVERFTGGDAAAEAQLVSSEPVGRMGTPDEVASAVLWLCSDSASFVTGHALVVDGGFVAR
ncbi:MAG TPA: SDR family oxidoreductase [Longimicrobium sp.]|nr:SDR family oxidoreductase [Longimicrobium sp.]